MPDRSPEQIEKFVNSHLYRMDLPSQFLGDEPNSYRKPWDSANVRACMVASWPYEQAAGNQSIPAVYKAINIGREDFLCDRFYLPATKRDMRLLEQNGIPIFGIESKHQLRDFDIVGTSISYQILTLSFVKMLSISDIPVRWADREEQGLEKFPMVLVGGQSYGAPEVLSPVVDCWWLGEVEDEPGNPGITSVLARIDTFKKSGRWQTDRLSCYRDLALEYNFLYFPRFIDVHYSYEDRSRVGVSKPSKQVTSYTSNLEGMRLPFSRRYVKNLNNIAPLDDQPLLYSDPGMGSGDLEAMRGCPAWCSFCSLCLTGDTEYISREGTKRFDQTAGTIQEVWSRTGWRKAEVAQYGVDKVNKITFAPAFLGWSHFKQGMIWKKTASRYSVQVEATALHRWPLVDGSETHHLAVGDFVRSGFVEEIDDSVQYDSGFVHGLVFGDGTQEKSRVGDQSNRYRALLWGEKDSEHIDRFEKLICGATRQHDNCGQAVCVTSIKPNGKGAVRAHINSRVKLKEFPAEGSTSDYVRGFIEGWAAADQTVRSRREDRIRLNTQHPEAVGWFRSWGAFGGWPLVGVFQRKSMETNFGTRKNPILELSLSRSAVWKVIDIEAGSEEVPVFCATVPGDGFFALARGLTTGNTYRQKPARQRSVPYMTEMAATTARNLGATRLSPFGPDFPMHTEKKTLIASLLENVSDEVDAQAMRVDDFIADDDYILLQVQGGMDGVTLGLEGNSQRMRDLVGKGTADADVIEAVTRGIRAGIRKFKLFMIMNLPGENEGDIVRILKLGKALADIRESLGQPHVRIQFSWTPLMIEANTPFQWFAPTVESRVLADVWEEFRDLKIEFKIGAKSEPNKLAFFQLCQRASREVGEALVDVMLKLDQACWGGVPRHTKELINECLKERGFHNGLDDCFDERFKNDLFGWEFIDQGVSPELLWVTYQQMREFVEQTDSHTYDHNFDDNYHGNEWVERCDTRCLGKTCGACDHEDLKIRMGYIKAAKSDNDVDLLAVRPVDQKSRAFKIRAQIFKPERYRFVLNDHWRFNVRRAAYRAQFKLGMKHGIVKRSIKFASDDVKYKDWSCGIDYVEFAMTRRMPEVEIKQFIDAMNIELHSVPGDETSRWLEIRDWIFLPASVPALRTDVDLSLFELELDVDPSKVAVKLQDWRAADYIKMVLHQEGSYYAPFVEEVNAKDYVDDFWLVRDGHRLKLRMLVRGRPSPYVAYAALMGRSSWLDAAQNPAVRLDSFVLVDKEQGDFLRPNCLECGLQIPTNILDVPYDYDRCPRCRDEHDGSLVKESIYV